MGQQRGTRGACLKLPEAPKWSGQPEHVPDQRLRAGVAPDHRPGRTRDTLGGSPGTCQRQPPQASDRTLPSRPVTDQLTQTPPPPEHPDTRDGVLGHPPQPRLPSKGLHADGETEDRQQSGHAGIRSSGRGSHETPRTCPQRNGPCGSSEVGTEARKGDTPEDKNKLLE